MNGADALVDGRWLALSRRGLEIFVLSETVLYRYSEGERHVLKRYGGGMRSKHWAAFRCLFRNTHYLREKFLTRCFQAQAISLIRGLKDPVLYASFLVTGAWLRTRFPSHLMVVESHNDEIEWFRNIQRETSNPVTKLVAGCSIRWLHRTSPWLMRSSVLAHVSGSDARGMTSAFGDHQYRVVPVGVEMPRHFNGAGQTWEVANLLFVGSLGVSMNKDALIHFANKYEQPLRQALGVLNVVVAGSSPSDEIVALCKQRGWTLKANVEEEELAETLASTTYSIMPFPYMNGAKLKLLKSLSHGVPVLGTAAIGTQLGGSLPECVFSDDPQAWVEACLSTLKTGRAPLTQAEIRSVAATFSWDAVGDAFMQILEDSLQAQRELIER